MSSPSYLPIQKGIGNTLYGFACLIFCIARLSCELAAVLA